MTALKVFGLLYFISFAFMYYFSFKRAIPPVLPGDIFIRQQQKHFYLPTGTAFYISILIFLFLKILLPNF